MHVRAPAKINVSLEVVGKLPDGYHRIRSVLVRLDKLFDAIDIRIGAGAMGITVTSDVSDLPVDGRNICHQAARAYLNAVGEEVGVNMHIRKGIPISAGLGGGSSDAAAVLKALNNHFGQRLAPRALRTMGSTLGKDVPFFLGDTGTAIVSQAGDRIRAIPAFPFARFLIVNPGIPISTAEAYRSLAQGAWYMNRRERADLSRRMVQAIRRNDSAAVAAALYNDFEIIAERAYPVIKELKQALLAFGARGALMSGSGSTVFGLFGSTTSRLRAEKSLRAHYSDFIVKQA